MKLSIITINLNNAEGLKKTIESVIAQTYVDFQYIVIDGNSSDRSVEIIKRNESKLSYWVSEPNRGIYGNMNRGLLEATGEYCLFLNSGDWLSRPSILEEAFSDNIHADIVSGDIYFYDNDKQKIKWFVPSPKEITAKPLILGTLPHQATFIKKELFTKLGVYNETLKVVSDWLFFVEALIDNGCTYQHISLPLAYFNTDGVSSNPKTSFLGHSEKATLLSKKYPLFLPDYEKMEELEQTIAQWTISREYKAYEFLKRFGVITIIVFFLRIKKVLERKLKLK